MLSGPPFVPPDIQQERQEVARRMMKARVAEGQSYGKWADEWVEHPTPTMNEPHKAVSWLTARASIDEDRMADMFLDWARADRQPLHEDAATVQRIRAARGHLERPQCRLAWVLAVQPAHGSEVPDDLPCRQQLDIHRQ